MHGYIYITTNVVNGRMYVGQRRGVFNPSYLGSGKGIKAAVSKYGKESFIVDLLFVAFDQIGLNEAEVSIIKDLNAVKDPIYYNIAVGGDAWGSPHTEETRAKIGAKARGRVSPLRGKSNPVARARMLRFNPMRDPTVAMKVSRSKKGTPAHNRIERTFEWCCEQCGKTETRRDTVKNHVRFCGKSCAATWHNLTKSRNR